MQLQTADTDIDAAYVQEGAAITTVNSGNVSRAEFPDVVASFRVGLEIAGAAENATVLGKIQARNGRFTSEGTEKFGMHRLKPVLREGNDADGGSVGPNQRSGSVSVRDALEDCVGGECG